MVLAFVAVVATTVVASSGSAGGRAAEVTFDAFPGPAEVTYGELIAYRATFDNTSGTTLTKTMFRQRYPVAQGQYATPVDHTCPSTPTTIQTSAGPEWVCDFGNLPANATEQVVTSIWRVPTLSTVNCPGCLVSLGRWTVKEGVNDQTDPNDAFFDPDGPSVAATLLASAAGGAELLKAGGYETAPTSCENTEGPGNLRTNPTVNLANPVSTTVCLPPFSVSSTDLGHVTVISELLGNARHSEVCVAELGTNCEPGYDDADFSPEVVTHVFRVANGALPKGYKITTVSHNGGDPVAEGDCDDAGFCVVSIDLVNKTKIWTIVVTSPTNGFYDW
jgi:hypothetical protein